MIKKLVYIFILSSVYLSSSNAQSIRDHKRSVIAIGACTALVTVGHSYYKIPLAEFRKYELAITKEFYPKMKKLLPLVDGCMRNDESNSKGKAWECTGDVKDSFDRFFIFGAFEGTNEAMRAFDNGGAQELKKKTTLSCNEIESVLKRQ